MRRHIPTVPLPLLGLLFVVVACTATINVENLPAQCQYQDKSSIISAVAEHPPFVSDNGETAQWFLSLNNVAVSTVNYPKGTMKCIVQPIDYNVVPPFKIGLPYPNFHESWSTTFSSMFIIPRQNPKVIQFWSAVPGIATPIKWYSPVDPLQITSNPFENWKGIIPRTEFVKESNRIFIYSSSQVVDVSFTRGGASYFTLNTNLTFADGFLSNTLDQVSSVVIVDDVLYVARTSKDTSLPGEIVMIDVKRKPMKYIKSVYLEHAPTSLIGWVQSWGVALYWTSRQRPGAIDLSVWDLTTHAGELPTDLTISTNSSECLSSSRHQVWRFDYRTTDLLCADLAPVYATQNHGDYALLTFTPCDATLKKYSATFVELLADSSARTVCSTIRTSIDDSRSMADPRAAVIVPNAIPAAAVLGVRSANGTVSGNGLALVSYGSQSGECDEAGKKRLFKFGRKNDLTTKEQSSFSSAPPKKRNVEASIPPFCSSAQCGPDQAVPQCSTGQCVFYSAVSSWLCCRSSPFG